MEKQKVIVTSAMKEGTARAQTTQVLLVTVQQGITAREETG